VARKADNQQKQRLRRREWDEDVVDAEVEPEKFTYGETDESREDDEENRS
jgi:hypothetical protein